MSERRPGPGKGAVVRCNAAGLALRTTTRSVEQRRLRASLSQRGAGARRRRGRGSGRRPFRERRPARNRRSLPARAAGVLHLRRRAREPPVGYEAEGCPLHRGRGGSASGELRVSGGSSGRDLPSCSAGICRSGRPRGSVSPKANARDTTPSAATGSSVWAAGRNTAGRTASVGDVPTLNDAASRDNRLDESIIAGLRQPLGDLLLPPRRGVDRCD